jgi:hypothetical protein
MYAFIVKNDQDTWDIWETMGTIPIQDREERLQNYLQSEFPIIGMDLTAYQETATSGAFFDGTDFIGGAIHPFTRNENADWNFITQYGYICDNVLLLIMYGQPGTDRDEQLSAIFQSETSIINVPEGQTAKVGDIWDGEKVIHTV